jgi:hypothetical protein
VSTLCSSAEVGEKVTDGDGSSNSSGFAGETVRSTGGGITARGGATLGSVPAGEVSGPSKGATLCSRPQRGSIAGSVKISCSVRSEVLSDSQAARTGCRCGSRATEEAERVVTATVRSPTTAVRVSKGLAPGMMKRRGCHDRVSVMRERFVLDTCTS